MSRKGFANNLSEVIASFLPSACLTSPHASDARFTPADHPQMSATCTKIEPPNRYSVTRLVVSALLFIRLQASANHATSTMMNFVLP
jgi:hypothetical protein